MSAKSRSRPAGAIHACSRAKCRCESGARSGPAQAATRRRLNARRDNAVFVFHSLTGSTDAAEWWRGVVGPGCAIDTDRYAVFCPEPAGLLLRHDRPEHARRLPGNHTRDMARSPRPARRRARRALRRARHRRFAGRHGRARTGAAPPRARPRDGRASPRRHPTPHSRSAATTCSAGPWRWVPAASNSRG